MPGPNHFPRCRSIGFPDQLAGNDTWNEAGVELLQVGCEVWDFNGWEVSVSLPKRISDTSGSIAVITSPVFIVLLVMDMEF